MVSKIAYSLNQLFSWIHVKSLEPYLKGFPINALLLNSADSLEGRITHHCYFLEGLIEIV